MMRKYLFLRVPLTTQLIPMSFIAKEAQHVEGFAPELAIVTKGKRLQGHQRGQ